MTQPFSTVWRAHGDMLARNAGQWEFNARILLQGADVCQERHERAGVEAKAGSPSFDLVLGMVAIYLAAQAVEVLLKALAVQRQPDIASGPKLYKHDLVAIATQHADVSLTAAERKMLLKLRKMITWAGRYPIPQWGTDHGRKDYDVIERGTAMAPSIDAQDLPWTVSWQDVRGFANKLRALFAEREAAAHRAATDAS